MERRVLLGILLLWPVVACGGEDVTSSSVEAKNAATQLVKDIRNEIKQLGEHEWAGEYFILGRHSFNSLILAPKTGYVYTQLIHNIADLDYSEYGTVTFRRGRLQLSLTDTDHREGLQRIAEELVPISWGNRTYLVASDQGIRFCNNVNSGVEPRSDFRSRYLIRTKDVQKNLTGFPTLPPEFRPYLLASPIEADIIEVGNSTTRLEMGKMKIIDTPVTLNAGRKDGLLPDMTLYVIRPKTVYGHVMVTTVEERNSQAVMTQVVEKRAGPRTVVKLSTRLLTKQKD